LGCTSEAAFEFTAEIAPTTLYVEFAASSASGPWFGGRDCGPEFDPAGSNYISQYSNDARTFAEASPVTITEGGTSEVSATLQQAGRVTGTVTDAASHKPLPGIEVTVLENGQALCKAAATGEGGEYQTPALRPGNYTLEVGGSSSYVTADEPVTIAEGHSQPGVDVALARVGSGGNPGGGGPGKPGGGNPGGGPAPANTGSGNAAGGGSTGTATGHGTAGGTGGVPAPSGSSFTAGGGVVDVALQCVGEEPCTIELTLTSTQAGHAARAAKSRRVLVGLAHATLKAGTTSQVRVTLTSAGRRLLRSRHGRIGAQLTISGRAGASAIHDSKAVTIATRRAARK
jgi:hypothetical protein